MQISRFASLKNDDDYDSENKEHMSMQDDDDFNNPTINSDNNQIFL